MAVQEHDPAKPVGDEIVDQIAQQVEVGPGRGRERAGKVEMMVRVSQLGQGGPDDPVPRPLGNGPHDFFQQHTVGEDWQMPALLLNGGDGHHHRNILSKTAAIAGQLSS